MHIEVLSLFPKYIEGPLQESILKRAIQNNLLNISAVDIRDFSSRKDRRVDDRPFGGGPGMVMMAEPTVAAIRSCRTPNSKVIYLSPQGKLLTSQKAKELASLQHLILLCGHYEGIDQRAIESDVDEELSIGDYVLTNGCLAALVVIDALARFIPGVLGHEDAALLDSFEAGIFDHPHYTKPVSFEEKTVPEILLSGDHAKIDAWRRSKAYERTLQVRPDLIAKTYCADADITTDERIAALKEVVVMSSHFAASCRFYEKVLGIVPTLDERGEKARFALGNSLFSLIRSEKASTELLSFSVSLGQYQRALSLCRHDGGLQPFAKQAMEMDLLDPDGRVIRCAVVFT
jgi:tRNA (guanine37-N1)-methyltransferase